MKHIRMDWVMVRGHWKFNFWVSTRCYEYETWDGLVAQDIITASERKQTGEALNLAKSFCRRTDKLELAARNPNMVQEMVQPDLPMVDSEAETQPIIARARLQDSTGVCECGAIGYGDGQCLSCRIHVCEEGPDHVQR